MLDQLIESKNHSGENRRREGFLLSTFTAAFSLLTFALIYSLFSYNLVMGSEKLEMSSLVSPVPMPQEAEEPPAPPRAPEVRQQNTAGASASKLPTRQENIQRLDEVPNTAPTHISTAPNTKLSRPDGAFKIGPDFNPSGSGNNPLGRTSGAGGTISGVGISSQKTEVSKEIEDEIPPPVKIPAPKAVKVPAVITSKGVLNGQALNLVRPVYPQPAKAVRAGGAVNVQVTIDENGNVTSASAVSGHSLLRQVSEQAARASKFSSTLLGTQKVKVTGVIVYNFVP